MDVPAIEATATANAMEIGNVLMVSSLVNARDVRAVKVERELTDNGVPQEQSSEISSSGSRWI